MPGCGCPDVDVGQSSVYGLENLSLQTVVLLAEVSVLNKSTSHVA